MIQNEIKVFFTALMFYTRFPVPKSTGYSGSNLHQATRYFPLIGIIIGGLGAAVFIGAHLILSTHVSLLLSMGSMILATGAFHEDAFSDFCDGFGGGYTKENILAIMKDSRIGTYGATGLIFLILSKFFLLSEINVGVIPYVIVAAHALSRINPVLMIYFSTYVRDEASGKSASVGHKNTPASLIIAIVIGVLPLCFVSAAVIPALLTVNFAIFGYFFYYVNKKIGGYTGDVLGALQQLTEVGFYLTFLITSSLL